MTKISLQFIKDHSYCQLDNLIIFNGIALLWDSSYQLCRTISFLNTLENYIQSNLAAVSFHEGTICMFWKSLDMLKAIGNEIELPDGDIWICESFFMPQ